MRIAVIVNAAAGTARQSRRKELLRTLAAPFLSRGHHVSFQFEEGKALGKAIRHACADPDLDAIVLGGGDGTVSRSLAQVVPSGKAIGILPLGTMNYVAQELGVPLAPDLAAAALAAGIVRRIDLGLVNDRMFLIRACCGVLPEFIRARDPVRRKRGSLLDAIGAGILGVAQNYPLVDVSLRWDGGASRVCTPFLMISNNICVDSAPLQLRRGRLDEGTLAVYVARGIDPVSLISVSVQALLGRWMNNEELPWFTTKWIEVEGGREIDVSIDGEVEKMTSPLSFKTLPAALHVLCPVARG